MALVLRLALAAVLAGAALAKLAAPRSSRAALATFGVRPGPPGWIVWGAVVAVELGLAAGVALGFDLAAYGAAALLAGFAALLAGAIARGRSGAPCACFGSRSTVGWWSVARNAALAAAFAALPSLPSASLSTQQWLAVGLVIALVAVAGLAVVVLALAREVGLLRLQLGPQAALEIPDEGPPLGSRPRLDALFRNGGRAELAVAVFVSEGCRLCRALEPAVASLGREPALAVATFDERRDADVWRALAIPGSPFAVAFDAEGVVRAKGTFNSLAQLEGILAAAERRTRPAPVA